MRKGLRGGGNRGEDIFQGTLLCPPPWEGPSCPADPEFSRSPPPKEGAELKTVALAGLGGWTELPPKSPLLFCGGIRVSLSLASSKVWGEVGARQRGRYGPAMGRGGLGYLEQCSGQHRSLWGTTRP